MAWMGKGINEESKKRRSCLPIRDILPVGSVVKLKNADEGAMLLIAGVLQSNEKREERISDYLGYLYPEGYINYGYQILFDNDAIEEVCFRGYESEERQQFLKELEFQYGEEE